MLALVTAHLLVAALLPVLSARHHRTAFLVAALLPAGALVWALVDSAEALRGGVTRTTAWAPELGLSLTFRLDALSLVMVVLVSGLGALILVYSGWYFEPANPNATSPDAARSAALLLAFAGAMLGLVLADDLLTLYVFWEITSVASFLLVGQGGQDRESRRAAVQALLVTVFGGLAMLLGFVLLGEAAGTYRISEIVTDPPGGPMVAAALVLILLGAFTKSAQLPFHPWLPAAMVAPTPVSAYLHAASMVKAGVYLVARLAPAFAAEPVWWVPVVVAGLGTMLIGGWRALHETDLKRLLAFGTVSQLGFLMVLLGAGGRTTALAGITMLLAHGLFKAPLFLVVGILDKRAGSRDIRELSGVGRALPGLALMATLAAASMAGLPPLLGFLGKEAAFEAFLHSIAVEGAAVEGVSVRGWFVALGLLAGSVLTAAYSARFLWGAFARKRGVEPTVTGQPEAGLTLPAWIPALAGLALGLAYPVMDALGASYVAAYPPGDGTTSRSGTGPGSHCCSPRSPSGWGWRCTAGAQPRPPCTDTCTTGSARNAATRSRSRAWNGWRSWSPGGCRSGRCRPTSPSSSAPCCCCPARHCCSAPPCPTSRPCTTSRCRCPSGSSWSSRPSASSGPGAGSPRCCSSG